MVVKLRVQIKLRQALRLFVSARKRGVWFDRDALEILFSAMVALGRFMHSTKFYLQLDLTLDGTEVYENMKTSSCGRHRWKIVRLHRRNRPVMSPSCMYESDVRV